MVRPCAASSSSAGGGAGAQPKFVLAGETFRVMSSDDTAAASSADVRPLSFRSNFYKSSAAARPAASAVRRFDNMGKNQYAGGFADEFAKSVSLNNRTMYTDRAHYSGTHFSGSRGGPIGVDASLNQPCGCARPYLLTYGFID